MVNYASKELKSNNGSKGDISVRTYYNPDEANPIDLSSNTFEVQKLKQHFSDESYIESILINGYLCGPGKKYKNGQLEYEGIFIKDHIYGPGKKYKDGKLEYSGEFANGKYNGKGTLYDEYGNVKYEGEFANGKYNGKGTLYDEYGNVKYEGEFANGKYNGKGTLYGDHMIESVCYDGEFSNGQAHGKGEVKYSGNTRYKGNFIKGLMQGQGQMIFSDRTIIEGFFSSNRPSDEMECLLGNQIGTYELNGYVKVYPKGDFKGDYYATYRRGGYDTGKKYFYDCDGHLVSIVEVDEDLDRNGIEYRYTKNGRESREFKIEEGEKKYIPIENCDDDHWYEGESHYWDILFNPLNEDKPLYLDEFQSYELMLDALENKAHFEVDIICPWISHQALSHGVFSAIKKALKRGVDVKILTGIGTTKDKNKTNKRYEITKEKIMILEDECKDFKGKLSIKEENTHEKMLLCDNDFMIYGSYNLLSCNPHASRWSDSMRYFTNPDEVFKTRKKYFNF